MIVGSYIDGRNVEYDESTYQFSFAGTPVSFSEIASSNNAGQIQWQTQELHDWFLSIDPDSFERAHARATGAPIPVGVPAYASTNNASGLSTTASYGSGQQYGGQPQQAYAQPAPQYAQPAQQPFSQPKKSSNTPIVIALVVIIVLFVVGIFVGVYYTTKLVTTAAQIAPSVEMSVNGHDYSYPTGNGNGSNY